MVSIPAHCNPIEWGIVTYHHISEWQTVLQLATGLRFNKSRLNAKSLYFGYELLLEAVY